MAIDRAKMIFNEILNLGKGSKDSILVIHAALLFQSPYGALHFICRSYWALILGR